MGNHPHRRRPAAVEATFDDRPGFVGRVFRYLRWFFGPAQRTDTLPDRIFPSDRFRSAMNAGVLKKRRPRR